MDVLTREYSKRLGVLSRAQLQAALSRFGLGELLDAEPVRVGMFGQNVMLRAGSGSWVLRGAPHSPKQFPSERCYSRLIHERTDADAPWPYLLEPSTELFGWSYALMLRIPGVALDDPELRDSLTRDGQTEIARAMGEHLSRLQSATWEQPGDFSYEADGIVALSKPYPQWFASRMRGWLDQCVAVSADTGATTEDDVAWVESVIDEGIHALAEPFDPVVVHTDYTEGNVVGERDVGGNWRVSGVFDLAESYIGDGEYDLVRSGAWYLQRLGPDGLRAFVDAYAARRALRPGYEKRFPVYVLQDRLIFWEFGQRNKIWFEPGVTLRAWAEPTVDALTRHFLERAAADRAAAKHDARFALKGYTPAMTFGKEVAAMMRDATRGDEEAAVAFLRQWAGDGPALELGIGTGRIALPLAATGIRVDGIDISPHVVEQMRTKPGGGRIEVTIGDFADVAVPDTYRLIYCPGNSFFNLLTQDDEVRCFENVAAHMTEDGAFVIESLVPDFLWRLEEHQYVQSEMIGVDHVRLDVLQHDPVNQTLDENHVSLTEGGVRFNPVVQRYAWPAEMDLMARIAGLRLRERWLGWERQPWTGRWMSNRERIVSVWTR